MSFFGGLGVNSFGKFSLKNLHWLSLMGNELTELLSFGEPTYLSCHNVTLVITSA